MSAQLKAATIRALYGALLTAALTGITALQTTDDARGATLATAAAFVSYMVARGAAEGLVDTSRAANGQVTPADVGYQP